MKIETQRLILRKPKLSDWKDIVEMANNKDFSKYLTHIPYPFKKKDAYNLIKNRMKKSKEDYHFFIELKSEKKVIGAIHLHFDNFRNVGLTSSWINKNYWKNGYITEAKIPIIDFAFNKLKLRKLNSQAISKNKASNLLQEKLGYKLEGILRKEVKVKSTGKIHDLNSYGLLKEDWKKTRPKVIKKLNEKISRFEK